MHSSLLCCAASCCVLAQVGPLQPGMQSDACLSRSSLANRNAQQWTRTSFDLPRPALDRDSFIVKLSCLCGVRCRSQTTTRTSSKQAGQVGSIGWRLITLMCILLSARSENAATTIKRTRNTTSLTQTRSGPYVLLSMRVDGGSSSPLR
jgi:hypothetical protein